MRTFLLNKALGLTLLHLMWDADEQDENTHYEQEICFQFQEA